MSIILFILAVLAFLAGGADFAAATTVFQQIVGMLSLLISATLLCGASIVEAVNGVKKEIKSKGALYLRKDKP